MADKRQLTTVTIDTDTGARLERLAKANGVSKKEFISLSLEMLSILTNVLSNDEKIIQSHQQDTEELKRAVLLLAKHMDEKNKAGLMGKLFG